jgi:VanZ family protein
LVALVGYFSLIPSPPETFTFTGGDKLIHLFAYFVMMLWFGLIYLPGRAYKNLGIGLIMMGLILELIQGVTSYRTLSYLDMLANALGVSLGWLLARTPLSCTPSQIESRLGSGPKNSKG